MVTTARKSAPNGDKSHDRLSSKIIKIISSKYFFYAILFLAALQGLWYAFSFQPTLFDESKHLGSIFIYSKRLNPFMYVQDPSWDYVGQLTRNGSYLFYYIMSWPLRIMALFTHDIAKQIVGLRLIMISFFVAGLIVYRKVLDKVDSEPRAITNLVFLLLVLTPSIAPLPGAVNYDNLVFLLFSVILLLSVRIVKNKVFSFSDVSWLLIIGMFMCLVKWTSIALFIPVFLYLAHLLLKRHGKMIFIEARNSSRKLPRLLLIITLFLFFLMCLLFLERPIFNIVRYKTPEPKCSQVISHERCLNFPDYAVYDSIDKSMPKDFQPVDMGTYFVTLWFPRMVNTNVSLLSWRQKELSPALVVTSALYFTFSVAGLVVLMIYIRDLLKNKVMKFFIVVVFGYCAILIVYLYSAYREHAIPAAISARYLIPVLPVLIYLVITSFARLFGKYKRVGLGVLIFLTLLLATQGGGIITHSVTAPDALYWQNNKTRVVNNRLRHFLKTVVVDTRPSQ